MARRQSLETVKVPVSSVHHSNLLTLSKLDKIHAARVALLPIRREKGHYELATPTLTSAAEVSDFRLYQLVADAAVE
jgi:phospholipase C